MRSNKQKRHATDNALEFSTFTAGCGGNDLAINAVFHQGLNVEVLTELALNVTPLSTTETSEPMQITHAKLDLTEHERARRGTLCFYCRILNHFVAQCPT